MRNINLAAKVCQDLNIDNKDIEKAVNSFSGVPRRYEYLGDYKKSKIYIDYAHHPTEVKAFMETFLKENAKSQIIFQPHTYSRTKNFIKEFISIFSNVENLIIFKEYSAREKPTQGLSAKDLYNQVKKFNANIKYCD